MGMSTHDPEFTLQNTRKHGGFLRWLGFGASPDESQPEGAQAPVDNSAPDGPRERHRRQLLARIGSFLLSHRLEINTYTLAIGHDVITGADPRLAQTIDQRVQACQPVTIDWLEEAGRNCGRGDGAAVLNALMTKLETSLEDFGKATRAARTATTEYNSALETHVDELEQVSKAGVVISELATIAKVMLQRTREIEQEMSRSEMQTRTLQKNLDEARRKAEMDHLTGLPNRRAFETVLDKEFEAAVRTNEPLCVAFCDIDLFKRINDTHGHEAGDRVIKAVAQALAKISNDKCHVARHGGEEFVILFRDRTLDEAWAVLDETREGMAERRLVNRATDVPFGQITFSGGIADVFAHASPSEALKAADEALYAAKAAGRNRIAREGEFIQIEQEAA